MDKKRGPFNFSKKANIEKNLTNHLLTLFEITDSIFCGFVMWRIAERRLRISWQIDTIFSFCLRKRTILNVICCYLFWIFFRDVYFLQGEELLARNVQFQIIFIFFSVTFYIFKKILRHTKTMFVN